MAGLALLIELIAIVTPADPRIPAPTLIVEDKSDIRRTLAQNKIRFDRVFITTLEDAVAARGALGPYLKHELEATRDEERRERLKAILDHIEAYTWHCGGFERKRERSLFCSVVRFRPPFGAGTVFPAIADGGITVCRCIYRLRDRRLASFEWNGDG
ncbi:MAG TPA: hypothetical protein VN903_17320 [Polyangia bacterium]|jgi:hypothetical protein|nr:hypothetical protein [Polyangia bacterium]